MSTNRACPRPARGDAKVWDPNDAARRMKAAMQVATRLSKELTSKSIRHAVIGGIAVVVHGYRRITDDADLLVLDENAFEGNPLSVVPGVSFCRNGVNVEALNPDEHEDFLRDAVDSADLVNGIPVIGIDALVYLKLKAGRTKDHADVVELIRRSKALDSPEKRKAVQKYLKKNAPDLAEDWPSLVAEANAQRDAGPQ